MLRCFISLAFWPTQSGLIAIPLSYGRSDEPFSSFAVRFRPVGGAPIRKGVRDDVDAHDDVSVGLESRFHFLGNLQPLLPGTWHLVGIVGKFEQRRIIFFFDLINSNRRRRPIVQVGHANHPTKLADNGRDLQGVERARSQRQWKILAWIKEQQDGRPRLTVPKGPRRSNQGSGLLKTRAKQMAEAVKSIPKVPRPARRRSDMMVSAAPDPAL